MSRSRQNPSAVRAVVFVAIRTGGRAAQRTPGRSFPRCRSTPARYRKNRSRRKAPCAISEPRLRGPPAAAAARRTRFLFDNNLRFPQPYPIHGKAPSSKYFYHTTARQRNIARARRSIFVNLRSTNVSIRQYSLTEGSGAYRITIVSQPVLSGHLSPAILIFPRFEACIILTIHDSLLPESSIGESE